MSPRNSLVLSSLAGVALSASILAQVTQRVSVGAGGTEANGPSMDPNGVWFSISADGRFVAFSSDATNLVPGDTNGAPDVFVRDRQTGAIERVDVATDGTQADMGADSPSISADGRYVVFQSLASNLVPLDQNPAGDIYIRDREAGTTELVSLSSAGVQGNGWCGSPAISADGAHVVFFSAAGNLVAGDTNGELDVFVRDLVAGTTERASVATSGTEANNYSVMSAISADGRYVAFESLASNLVPADTNQSFDVFVRDRGAGTTERVSVSSTGGQQAFGGLYLYPSISADGRYVAFVSEAQNLVIQDSNLTTDAFVHDRRTSQTLRVSVGTGGVQGNSWTWIGRISGDGRYVVFASRAGNFVQGDSNGKEDVFVHDRETGETERVSVSSAGDEGELDSSLPTITPDGRYVAFVSLAWNLVPGDGNDDADVFVRDRTGGTGFASLCDPGTGGVTACPCANAPSGPGQGCDNSAATGGATLTASGGPFLSSDSLRFTTSGQLPSSLSILVQGNAEVPGGVAYGQGVRCLGGSNMRRLYALPASGGSIEVPDFESGDESVSARSAEKGDVIQPGESRWYLVLYRDPVVLGGCPAASSFNATQTGAVSWLP